MAKVITFSQVFPHYHQKRGQPTQFVEKFWASINVYFDYKAPLKASGRVNSEIKVFPKHHTIREGFRWKVGDCFSPRIWSDKPYRSKQIIIGPDTLIKKIYSFYIGSGYFKINDRTYFGETESDFEFLEMIALNDGLDRHDLMNWFKYQIPFNGQIICWNDCVNYEGSH